MTSRTIQQSFLGLSFTLVFLLLSKHVVALPGVYINCSVNFCGASQQDTIEGLPMFDESRFFSIVDGFGRERKFWVHLPANYDTVDGENEKIPVVFVFHGFSQNKNKMVLGKWDEYFDDNIAFVIPQGEPDPCNNLNESYSWMYPSVGFRSTPDDLNCDLATLQSGPNGNPITYWNASIAGTFNDILFIEELRAMVLERFPKLNTNKVYATGFSAGGGLAYSLLCYRSSLFRGFSIVAFTLAGDVQRGDYNNNGIDETDPNSLMGTCGKSGNDPGHATGIINPHLWGSGSSNIPLPIEFRITKPIALFVGDQDLIMDMDDINATGSEIRERNNLTGRYIYQNPFSDVALSGDYATTQRRTFRTPAQINEPHSVFRRFLVEGWSIVGIGSGTHGVPDVDSCLYPSLTFMTCDYDYTEQTKLFFEQHADLNLNP